MLYYIKKLEESGKSGDSEEHLNMVSFGLKCMARGGIHDHVGGGFHRYSVDECWHGQYLVLVFISPLYFVLVLN